LTTQAIQFGFGFTDGFVGWALLPFITHVIILHEERGSDLQLRQKEAKGRAVRQAAPEK
jgi:hypothetical protein|tara:strand:- start:2222 stop:2398 length:177 start_codon:yes stop_codon:yes gene_type:complete